MMSSQTINEELSCIVWEGIIIAKESILLVYFPLFCVKMLTKWIVSGRDIPCILLHKPHIQLLYDADMNGLVPINLHTLIFLYKENFIKRRD